jgi:hypothetical protein
MRSATILSIVVVLLISWSAAYAYLPSSDVALEQSFAQATSQDANVINPFEALDKGRKRAAEDYQAGQDAKQRICARLEASIATLEKRQFEQSRLVSELERSLEGPSRKGAYVDSYATNELEIQRTALTDVRAKIEAFRKQKKDTGCDLP